MKEFHLQIVTPDGLKLDGMVESLLVRTDDGDVEFLAGHEDYMASLGTGRARIRVGGENKFASVSGGFVTVSRDGVKLVAVTFEFREEIDVSRAKSALESARLAVAEAKDERAMRIAEAKLKRAINRINIAEI